MDEQRDRIGSQDLKKDRSHAQEVGEKTPQPATTGSDALAGRANGQPRNGTYDALPNGLPVQDVGSATANGEAAGAIMAMTDLSSPPPLDQSWREHGTKPLGKLIERLGQQCYYDLNELINKMAETAVEHQTPQTNGVRPHMLMDADAVSLNKKRQILAFAQQQRERFTKALVLSDWSRNMDDIAKLIDVKVFQEKKKFAAENATRAVGQTKVDMIGAKMPNPNIEGAMEPLATGQASWIPDLGYIPPKRLPAKQLLKTLRSMNVTLATRLSLTDELPPQFLDYSVANGRATFMVVEEFEVDLSIADEDPSSPWYFIDLRFLFSPTSQTLNDQIRSFLEPQVNNAMASMSLQGCYDLLHNFVLTHKLNILHSQALELTQRKWFDCISVEKMRRSLVVQYWSGVPGPKSWIEFGIASGQHDPKVSKKQSAPSISVRWFRKGAEVKDIDLAFDWREINLERCLEQVVAKHVSWVLRSINERMIDLAADSAAVAVELKTSTTEPNGCSLAMSLPSMRRPLVIRIEPVTGQYSISPRSSATGNTERRLSNDPALEAARWVASLLCTSVQERVSRQAEQLGWLPVRDLVRRDDIKTLFGDDVWQRSIFVPSESWGLSWAAAVTFSLGGERWWVVQLKPTPDGSGTVIANAKYIPTLNALCKLPSVSRASLLQIEKTAVEEVSFMSLAQELHAHRLSCNIQKMPPLTSSAASRDVIIPPSSSAMYVSFRELMHQPHNEKWKPWAHDIMRITHRGFDDQAGRDKDDVAWVRHELRLTLEPGKIKQLQQHLTRTGQQSIAMNRTGGLSLQLRTPFGAPFANQLRTSLLNIDRLNHRVAVLQRRDFKCSTVSLSKLAFTYSTDPELAAQLLSAEKGTLPVRLRLESAGGNPHQRIRVMLEQDLNRDVENAFKEFTFLLTITLPLLQAFEKLEDAHLAKLTASVHARSSTWYALKYKEPFPTVVFQITARTKMAGPTRLVRWYIEVDRSNAQTLPETLIKALREVWATKGESWFGVGTGLIADVVGIGPALLRVDETVRRFERTKEPGNAKPAEGGPGKHKSPQEAQKQPSTRQMMAAATTKKKKRERDVIELD